MKKYKCVKLFFVANINNFELKIYDKYFICIKRVINKKTCICFKTNCDNIYVLATPLQNDYFKPIFLSINNLNNFINLRFKKIEIKESIYKFFLIDKTYNFGITGKLFFNYLN